MDAPGKCGGDGEGEEGAAAKTELSLRIGVPMYAAYEGHGSEEEGCGEDRHIDVIDTSETDAEELADETRHVLLEAVMEDSRADKAFKPRVLAPHA